jgi:hypothetical protein
MATLATVTAVYAAIWLAAIRGRWYTLAKNVAAYSLWVRGKAKASKNFLMPGREVNKLLAVNLPTWWLRRFPEIYIVGTVKGGTSSMHDYLRRHPQVIEPVCKAPNSYTGRTVFGADFDDIAVRIARVFSPLELTFWWRALKSGLRAHKHMDGSAFNLYLPWLPELIYAASPNTVIIICLRDPIERAYSHYQMETRRKGNMPATFEEAVDDEERVDGEFWRDVWPKCVEARSIAPAWEYVGPLKDYDSTHWPLEHAFTRMGLYADPVRNWYRVFPPEQILLQSFDELASDTVGTIDRLYRFVGVEPHRLDSCGAQNQAEYKMSIDPKLFKRLSRYFEEDMLALEREFNFTAAANWVRSWRLGAEHYCGIDRKKSSSERMDRM